MDWGVWGRGSKVVSFPFILYSQGGHASLAPRLKGAHHQQGELCHLGDRTLSYWAHVLLTAALAGREAAAPA